MAPAAEGAGGLVVGARPRCTATRAAGPAAGRPRRIGELLRYTQTVTLWHGVDRVDCQTTIDEFTGADRLVRLRWPCPVPGALPVSEVGDAVIGRGFGLIHERGSAVRGRLRRASVDAGQPGLRLVRAVVGRTGPQVGEKVRAVSVAEVVTPTVSARGARPDGRARARRRHRDVQQRRQAAIRRSRPSTPTCRTRGSCSADPTRMIHCGGVRRRRPGVRRRAQAAAGRRRAPRGCGCRASVAGRRVGAGCGSARRARAAGAGDRGSELESAVAAVVDDLADAEITVEQDAPRGMGPSTHDRRMLNRGIPSSPSTPRARCTPR